jgi:NhaP-type Na+/H+ or K+/H+ antiporter
VWFVFGAVMLVPGLEDTGWKDVLFALLALTVLRMVPVALALAGTGLDRATVAFVGWFGPRGLASVVFGLLAVDEFEPSQSKAVLAAVTLTIALSVLLHGISASPLAARYGAYASARLGAGHPAHGRAGGPAPLATRRLRRVGAQGAHRQSATEEPGAG